ncbi:hypothetical protein [Microbispora sp. NPDC049125]|uniref:hypothetical protein n=1 Tax=Microbispora sp. NPDC049125 TaxID=3154929 RepID=UPI0034657633
MTKRKRRSAVPAAERWTDSALAEWGLSERQRRILIWSGAVVAVLAIALVLTLIVNSFAGGQPAPAQMASGSDIGEGRPAAYQAWKSVKEFAPIADRKADAAPLTAQEVFAPRTLTTGKITLKRVGSRLDGSCAAAVWGADVTGALAEAGCTQAVRGLYTTPDGVYVAQYTLLNLSDVQAADGLVQRLTTLYPGGWVLPLESARVRFGAYSEASGTAMGHYAGLVWVGRADGVEPGENDDFVTLALAAREAEKAVFRRVVAVAGLPAVPTQRGAAPDTAQPSEPAPSEPGASQPGAGQPGAGQPGAGQSVTPRPT